MLIELHVPSKYSTYCECELVAIFNDRPGDPIRHRIKEHLTDIFEHADIVRVDERTVTFSHVCFCYNPIFNGRLVP